MKSTFVILALIGIAALDCFGQSPRGDRLACTAASAQKVNVRGLHLGLNVDQVFELFPGSKQDSNLAAQIEGRRSDTNFGLTHLSVSPSNHPFKEKYAGIGSLSLSFLDGRVTSLSVSYMGPEWRNVDEFVTKLAESFALPPSYVWHPDGAQGRLLRCGEVLLNASIIGGGNYFSVRDTLADKAVDERKEATKEKARREFRP